MATIDAPPQSQVGQEAPSNPVAPPTSDSSSPSTIEALLAGLRGANTPTKEELAFGKPPETPASPVAAVAVPPVEGSPAIVVPVIPEASGAVQPLPQAAPAWETGNSVTMGASTQEVPVVASTTAATSIPVAPVAPEAIPQAVQQSAEATAAVQNAAGQTVIGEPTFAPASVADASKAETAQLIQESGAVPPAIPSADANVGSLVDQVQVVTAESQAVVDNTGLETVRPPLSKEQRESAGQVIEEIAANKDAILAFIKSVSVT